MQIQLIKRILAYARPYLHWLFLALIAACISVGFTLAAPIVIGKIVDYIIGYQNVNYTFILPYLLLLSIITLAASFFQYLMMRFNNKVTFQIVYDLRTSAFYKLNSLPLHYIDKTPYGNVINTLISDIDQISDGLIQGFTQLFTGIITVLITIGFMFSINYQIALLVIVITPLSFFVASFIAKRSFHHFRDQARIKGQLSGYIEEMIQNQQIVTTFNYQKRAQAQFEEINAKLYHSGFYAQFYSSITNPCTRYVNGVVYAIVGIAGTISAIYGMMSIGQISSFLAYANQYSKPFNEISGVISELQTALASCKRVFDLLDQPEEIDQPKLLDLPPTPQGHVQFEKVCFQYDPQVALIQNFSIEAMPGQKIAIVGPTGCGKTTLINLLMRFYPIQSGQIKVDGVDSASMSFDQLRLQFGMVLQDSWLFSGTLRDNIAYGNENASQEDVEQAARKAHIHSFIERLPAGYDTILSPGGLNISSGQKQLLCIARIMLMKPKMLILDEATSNIDTRTEVYVQKAFDELMQGHTSFIVAHRLSTIQKADRILVMNHGQIIEQGNHEALLQQKGFYYDLYNSQFANQGL